jgi:hypothetical protein
MREFRIRLAWLAARWLEQKAQQDAVSCSRVVEELLAQERRRAWDELLRGMLAAGEE